MKFERIVLERFGHFEALDLDLSGGPGLVVVYGPNEAGKTTLLRALHSLLFGVDERTPYAFEYDYKAIALRAVMRDTAGQRLELTRLKKRKDSLIGSLQTDAGEVPLDAARFARYFGGVTEELYQAIFGFTHGDLQEGSKVLEVAGLAELLGGGALGGSGEKIRGALAALQLEGEGLFKAKGKNPAINRTLTQLRDARLALREAVFQQPQYLALTSGLAAAREEAAAAELELARLRERDARLLTLLAVFEDFHEHLGLQRQIEDPALRTTLDETAAERARTLRGELSAADARLATVGAELTRLLARAEPPAGGAALLAEATAIERLVRRVDTAAQQRLELPRERERVELEAAALRASLASLSPGTCPEDHAQWAPPPGELDRLRPLAARWHRARQELQMTERALGDDEAELAALQASLAALAAEVPADGDQALVAELERAQSERADLEREEQAVQRLGAELELGLSRLRPSPPRENLAALPLPSFAELEELQSRRLEVEREHRSALADLSRETEELQRARAELAALDTGDLPDPSALPALRARRDERWADLRRALTGASSASEHPFGELFARAVGEYAAPEDLPDMSDPPDAGELPAHAAQGMFSDYVSKDRSETAPAEDPPPARSRRRGKSGDATEPTRARGAADPATERPPARGRRAADPANEPTRARRAEAPPAASPAAPRPPAARREPADTSAARKQQIRNYERAVAAADELADRLRDAADLLARRTGLERQVERSAAALRRAEERLAAVRRAESTWAADWAALWRPLAIDPGPPAAMLAWCRDAAGLRDLAAELRRRELAAVPLRPRVDAFLQRLRERLGWRDASFPALVQGLRERERAAQAARARLEAGQARLGGLQAALARGRAARDALARELADVDRALRERLRALALPDDLDVDAALGRLDALEDMSVRLRDLDARRAALVRGESALAAFDAECAALLGRLGERAGGLAPEQAVDALSRRLAEARTAAAAAAQAREQAEEKRREHATAARALATIHAELAALSAHAGAASIEDLMDMSERTVQRARLQRRQAELALRLARALGEGPARDEYAAELRDARRESLLGEQTELRRRLADLDRRRTAALEQKGKLENQAQQLGGDRAARLNAEGEALLADLGQQVDRYTLLQLAHEVLERVTDRYARENQPAILHYTSDMLARITGGRHLRVLPQPEAGTLAAVDRHGRLRLPGEMSLGTREQLFLALRLAYVLDYCDRNEPLPLVMDDVLVNFDEDRAATTLQALREVARTTQILFLTCHRHLMHLARQTANTGAELRVLELPGPPSLPRSRPAEA